MDQPRQALTYLGEALELSRQVGYKQAEADQLFSIGRIYHELGQPQKALKYLQEAGGIYKKIKNKNMEKAVRKTIASIKKQ